METISAYDIIEFVVRAENSVEDCEKMVEAVYNENINWDTSYWQERENRFRQIEGARRWLEKRKRGEVSPVPAQSESEEVDIPDGARKPSIWERFKYPGAAWIAPFKGWKNGFSGAQVFHVFDVEGKQIGELEGAGGLTLWG